MFLSPEELVFLTGYNRKADQIAALRTMGIRFFVNPSRTPIVTKAAVEGRAVEVAEDIELDFTPLYGPAQ
jgi:hypothetical protein